MTVRPSGTLLRGSFLMLISLSVAGIISLIISVNIARLLGVEQFGVYSILVSVQSVFILLAGFNVGTAMAKLVAEYNVRDPSQVLGLAKAGFFAVLGFSFIAGVIYVMLSGVIGNSLYSESEIVTVIPFSTLVVISSAVLAFTLGIVQGCQRIRLLALVQLAVPAANLCMVTVFVLAFGLRGAFLGFFVAQSVVATVTVLWLHNTGFPFLTSASRGMDLRLLKKVLSFSLPAVLGAALVGPIIWIANTELTLEEGFEVMGRFAVAMYFFQALSIVANALSVPLAPKLSEMSVNSHDLIEATVSNSIRGATIIIFPVIFAMALYSDSIVAALYGQSFTSSAPIVYLMLVAGFYSSLAAIIGSLVIGLGRMWVGLALNIIWASVFLVSALTAIPILGITGLGLAFAFSYFLHFVVCSVVSRTRLKADLHGARLPVALASVLFVLGFGLDLMVFPFDGYVRIILLLTGVTLVAWIGRDWILQAVGGGLFRCLSLRRLKKRSH